MSRLYLVRHGNTFARGEEPRRIGARTDLPLTAEGGAQATALGKHFADRGMRFVAAFAAPLARTTETAGGILAAMGSHQPVEPLALLTEIDHGPDEGAPESAVVARLGREALAAWDREAIVPDGWTVDRQARLAGWIERFEAERARTRDVLMVTSNGVARLARLALGEATGGAPLRLRTGAYGVIEVDGDGQRVLSWDVRPDER